MRLSQHVASPPHTSPVVPSIQHGHAGASPMRSSPPLNAQHAGAHHMYGGSPFRHAPAGEDAWNPSRDPLVRAMPHAQQIAMDQMAYAAPGRRLNMDVRQGAPRHAQHQVQLMHERAPDYYYQPVNYAYAPMPYYVQSMPPQQEYGYPQQFPMQMAYPPNGAYAPSNPTFAYITSRQGYPQHGGHQQGR